MDLPPGFRFHPTDEELITHYLTKKAMDETFSTRLMAEVDLNKCEPWDLPMAGRDQMGEKELYLLCKKDRKYPTGMRANRATGAGYWKATGKDKEVCRGKTLVGMKKTLVFYKGRAPKGEKTNWVMHEYRLEQGSSSSSYYSSYNNFARPPKSEWVLCRVFNKSSGVNKASTFGRELGSSSPLTPLMDVACFSTAMEEEFFTSFDGSHGGNLEEFMEMETKYSRNGIGRQIDGHEGPIQLTWAYAT